MPDNVRLALRALNRPLTGWLVLSNLPTSSALPEQTSAGAGQAAIREAAEYRYRIDDLAPLLGLEPKEFFDADDATLRTGRLSAGLSVGDVLVEAQTSDGVVLQGKLYVQPAKLADERAFNSMLSDLAEIAVEALHQAFAPSAGRFAAGGAGPSPRLLFQRFVVMRSLLFGADLSRALDQVLASPHTEWRTVVEVRRAGRPVRASSRLARTVTGPGPRVASSVAGLSSLPEMIPAERTEETVDSLPNRYLRFVLEQWRNLALEALAASERLSSGPRRRGQRAAQDALDRLEELLSRPLFRNVGRLSQPPQNNTVLLRRSGYRELTAAAAIVETSLGLAIDIDDPLTVSRRNIATLYEYWVFVRLSRAVATAFGSPMASDELFRIGPDGMSLVLRTGRELRLQYATTVDGVDVRADLVFNRTFDGDRVWTRPMRPDASLLLRADHSDSEHWVHFDAKYKVDWATPFATGGLDDEEQAEREGRSRREDLLKMHAYRDAIRNSDAAFVVFPGSVPTEFRLDDRETLPALGAVGLRPEHAVTDEDALAHLVGRLVRHVAADATRHRRSRFWTAKAYAGPATADVRPMSEPALERPPADTPVLLGYVRSQDHWHWVQQTQLYNVRAGDRHGAVGLDAAELEPRLLVLYGSSLNGPVLASREGPWSVFTRDDMVETGYPDPQGTTYLVSSLRVRVAPDWLTRVRPTLLGGQRRLGAPARITWLDLILAAAD